ncbi:hypothetical protein M9H77_12953 [Catharanthus roseus]|uniref:Uncharacterized protein n=1 Tax=Catharanthus roseus TaxID=4058 RepID=A0ACC0BIT0_CATRO|nr:hypothetical protein M9H77_12953 [Catharanthus roseus]
MEEVSAHVQPSPIVPDVLTRQHERRSGLIWSRDHETYIHAAGVQPSRCRPHEPVLQRGARGVKMGARRLPSGGPMEDALLPLHIWTDKDMQTPDMEEREVEDLEDGDVEIPDEHDDEPMDDVTLAQQLGHRVCKKTTRFMPSDWR